MNDVGNAIKDLFGSIHRQSQRLVSTAVSRPMPTADVAFRYDPKAGRISALEPFLGKGGWLELAKVTVASVETDEALVFSGHMGDGTEFDDDLCRKLMSLDADVRGELEGPGDGALDPIRDARVKGVVAEVERRNARHFDEEVLKLDRWAEDLKFGLEKEIKDLDKEMKDVRRASALAQSLAEKLEAQKTLKGLDEKRKKKRRALFDAQDAIDQKRDELIAAIEQQLRQAVSVNTIFTVRWRLMTHPGSLVNKFADQ